jgi:hypothetical protein
MWFLNIDENNEIEIEIEIEIDARIKDYYTGLLVPA